MKTRIITGVMLAFLLIPLLFVGEVIFYGVIGAFTLVAGFEMFSMVYGRRQRKFGLVVVQVLMTFVLYGVIVSVFLGLVSPNLFLLVTLIPMLFGLLAFVFDDGFSMSDFGKSLMSIWYVAGCFAGIAMIRSLGIEVLIYMLMLAMLTDMFAYFVGVAIGKHKLAPKISPKKTIEGSIGGTVIAVVIASIYASFVSDFIVEGLLLIIVVGVFVSALAQVGDLVASKMKREHDIKDFSRLLPGHGGVLDRFDSSLFAALALIIVVLFVEVL